MESSKNSMHKGQKSKAQTDDDYAPEESSWTYYIQDFLCENHEESSFSSGHESPSLITDAASSAAKKASHDKRNDHSSSFRKRKVKGTPLVDDDLEDTASSPINSPKVSYMNGFYQVKQKEKATIDISEGKMNTSGDNGLAVGGRDSDISHLKERGLCLVPLSTIANLL